MSDVDVQSGPVDAEALDLLAATLPVVLSTDLVAADGDRALAQRVAVWRAARAPLLADPELAERVGSTLVRSVRDAAVSDEVVAAASAMSCDELLWPLSSMLFAESWCLDLIAAAARGDRLGIVVSPPPQLGRVPWAALPLTDPEAGPAVRLIEVADVTVGLLASLASGLHRRPRETADLTGKGVVVADSLNNLPFARRLAPEGLLILGPNGAAAKTRTELLAALAAGHRLLVMNGHVRPGSDSEPASSALLLATSSGRFHAGPYRTMADVEYATAGWWTGITSDACTVASATSAQPSTRQPTTRPSTESRNPYDSGREPGALQPQVNNQGTDHLDQWIGVMPVPLRPVVRPWEAG